MLLYECLLTLGDADFKGLRTGSQHSHQLYLFQFQVALKNK